jgi:uncharacterized protein (DUF952 family)
MTLDAGQKFFPLVYKICRRAEWQDALRRGRYTGSADDRRDGFIHLSTGDQVAGTAAKHFKSQSGLVLVALAASHIAKDLRWEASRGGALFPHHYGPIDVTAARWVKPMPLGADGVPQLPPDLGSC